MTLPGGRMPALYGRQDARCYGSERRGRKKFKGYVARRCPTGKYRNAMDDEERARIRDSQNGDPTAFAELIKTHQRMIHALTYRMTGSLADAEDLAQETFIQAHHQVGQFRGEASFSSWLYRIAVNKCLNWRKREARRGEVHEAWAAQSGLGDPPTDDALAKRVQAALMKLHPKQRAAVVLTIYEGHNHAEAARVLGCSETTVSWRVFMARNKLKRLLATTGPDDERL